MSEDDQKLQSLDDRIQAAQDQANPPKPDPDSAKQIGMRAGGEFMAHVIAGALMGWGLDTLFGTAPLLMVLLLLVGFATGIYRSSRVLGEK